MPDNQTYTFPFSQPLYLMLKPAGSVCNLQCEYCYYLEKNSLYPDEKKFFMTEQLLEEFTRQYIESQTTQYILFTWHGGETLIRDASFYRKALKFQRKYGLGRQIDNCLQTNGTLLNEEWCSFFKENNFLVGISLDGTPHMHNKYRKNAAGKPSFDDVIKGVELLKQYNVEFNIMAVVNNYNVDFPREFYNFFKEMNCRFIQFTPVVERYPNGEIAPWSVPAEKWGEFLIAVFDEWIKNDVGEYFIQYFDSILANWVGHPTGLCTLAETCGHAAVMEFNGDVYSCDHFVFPEYKLGNIKEYSITEMMYSAKQKNFGNKKRENLPQQCGNCEFLFACNGECPKNRIIKTKYGEENLNYLCAGYYSFFSHIAPYMDFMKNEIMYNQPPANVMQAIRNGYFK